MLSRRCGLRSLLTGQRHQLRATIARSQDLRQLRHYSTEVKDVAVLGGGITGLATAHYIAKEFPAAKITVYEAAPKIGGWLLSKRVEVPGGSIIFEEGPRTLRSESSMPTAHLIQDLGLANDIIYSSKTSPAALNRFIYYPDHLVRLPVPSKDFDFAQLLISVISEPLLRGLLWPFLSEFFIDKRRDNLADESVGSFISRRLSPAVANNFLSAMIHGIYAGDIWKLSIKSIFPQLWEMEGRFDSITNALLYCWKQELVLTKKNDVKLLTTMLNSPLDPKLRDSIRSSAVYTFKDGIGQLVDRLAEHLKQNPNVTIKTDTRITGIYQNTQQQIEVGLPNQTKAHHSHMISTISAPALSALTERGPSNTRESKTYLPSLHGMHATTVQVVSLYYPDPNLLPHAGFGYLIPQTVPFAQNPEHALGVIFDSSYSGAQQPASVDGQTSQTEENQSPPLAQDSVPGTKLTVMLGGHWWDGYTYYPSDQEGLESARSVLQRHLGITVPPVAHNVVLQKNCIPQYTLGHHSRMRAAHSDLKYAFKGRLRVAGSWYTGVGVHDCIRGAWSVVQGLKEVLGTGLEDFDGHADPWVLVSRKPGKVEVKNET